MPCARGLLVLLLQATRHTAPPSLPLLFPFVVLRRLIAPRFVVAMAADSTSSLPQWTLARGIHDLGVGYFAYLKVRSG